IATPPVRQKLKFGNHYAGVGQDLAQRRRREPTLPAGLIILDCQTDRRKSGRRSCCHTRFQGKPGRVSNRRPGECIVTGNQIVATESTVCCSGLWCARGHRMPPVLSPISFFAALLGLPLSTFEGSGAKIVTTVCYAQYGAMCLPARQKLIITSR